MDPTQVAAWYETDRSEPSPMSRPAWMTKRRALVAALALLMLLPLISIWVRATHPRDEADFILAARADAPVAQADLGTAKPTAVMGLSDNQRMAVVLVHAFGWTASDVAELLEISATTVGTHLARGLANLRRQMDDPNETKEGGAEV